MTDFNFVGRKAIWFSLSAVVIAIGVAAVIINGLNFGIEFKGGTLFEADFNKRVAVETVRNTIEDVGIDNAVIQRGQAKSVYIRTRRLNENNQLQVKKALENIGAKDFIVQEVGASWGKRLTSGTLVALVIAVATILAFVALRFEFKMGVAAVVALLHDVLVAVGIYALSGRPVTTATVAAFLTILGYSIYDTIVIFDRVRENTARYKGKQTYSDLVNHSVNQSLRRSINTSLTSIVPVVSLMVFGGETLKDFAFALLIGLTSGTYSSIFIASPFLAMWKETEPKNVAIRKKLSKESA